jgi:hypothetical protein
MNRLPNSSLCNDFKPMKIKQDKYLKARGGHSKIIYLSCNGCGKKLGAYQKDDPSPVTGMLKRLYLDRCASDLARNMPPYRAGKRWDCQKCARYLGFAAPYVKENRKAWYLLIDAIIFKVGKKTRK